MAKKIKNSPKKSKLKNKFKVEFRKTCLVCGKKITTHRFRTYCSVPCRNKRNNQKAIESGYGRIWQRKQRDKIASKPSSAKVQCLVCGRYYVQVCSHAVQAHGFGSGREYREYFDLEVKRGVVPSWYRKVKGDMALENGTVKNLKAGAKYRFKPNDPKAGRYERSPITLERLKTLHLLNKRYNKLKFMVQESEIILLQKKLLQAIEASTKNQNCKKCGKKGQKVILLYETNEVVPSQLVLYCPSCQNSENFPVERSGDVLKFMLILERKMAKIINESKKSKIEE